MGIFNLNYDRPGKGIDPNAPKKTGTKLLLDIFWRELFNLMKLNMLYILCCLPIITIGPATAALTYVLRDFVRDKPTFIFNDYFRAFKSNFKQGLVYWILNTVVTALLLFSGYSAIVMNMGIVSTIFIGLAVGMLALLAIMSFYVYHMMVTVELPLKSLLRNAFYLSFMKLGRNLLVLLAQVVLVVVLVFAFDVAPMLSVLIVMLLLILIVPALMMLIVAVFCYPVVDEKLVQPQRALEGGENSEDSEDKVNTAVWEAYGKKRGF